MPKNKMFNLIQNFSYTLTSNLISLVISSIVILVVPKIIGVEEYGYWQLYLFYASYVGFLHFGWNDGIYLRYGGEKYEDLDKRYFFSQFWMMVIFQLSITFLMIVGSSFLFATNKNELFIFYMVSLNVLVVNTKYLLLYILQATNRMKEYSSITILDRFVYAVFIIVIVLFNIDKYQLMVFADLVGKFVSLIYAIYICKDIVFRKATTMYFDFKEVSENIIVGINLMIANIASNLIIGIVKFGIQRVWDVATFGKISLTLSISNLVMVFINALSLAIFPLLRRTDSKKLPEMYSIIRTMLMIPLLGVLLIYYPLKEILSMWLPQYKESLTYMALIFPMVIYEGKVALLTNTYLKTIRKERIILKVNIITVVVSLFTTLICTIILKNLLLAMVSIAFLLALRSILAEIMLAKFIIIEVKKDIILEAVVSILFILISWFINSWLGVLFYLIVYILYISIKRKDISNTYKKLKLLMK